MVKDITIKVKPKHVIYYGNSIIIKKGYVKEFYK